MDTTPNKRRDTRLGRASRRRGAVLTVILVFLLPLLVGVGLALVQLSLIKTAQKRVHAAARHAAECACAVFDLQDPVDTREDAVDAAHLGAGLVLGYLGGDYRTEIELLDLEDNDGVGDHVAAAVTIPMNAVSTSYLSLLCGSHVGRVRIRGAATIRCERLEGCLDLLNDLIECINALITDGVLKNNLLNSLEDILDRLDKGLPINASVCNDLSASFPGAVQNIDAGDVPMGVDPCCVQLSLLRRAREICQCIGCPAQLCERRLDPLITDLENDPACAGCTDPCDP